MPTLDQILQAIAYDVAILVDGTVNKISRVIYNGRIIWPVQNTGESIKRVILNGRIFWEVKEIPYLSLEKEYVWLDEYNDWFNTNQVLTNSSFTVN